MVIIWRIKDDQGRKDGIKGTSNIMWTNYLADSQAEEGGEAVGDKRGYIIAV